MKRVIQFISNTTMYRSMLYYLSFILVAAIILSALKVLPYKPLDIILTAAFLLIVSFVANFLLSKIFKAKVNPESQFITALIMALIIGPMPLVSNFLFLFILAVFANASKYILAIKKRHIFNPAAFAVVATAVFMKQGASWWVGSNYLVLAVALGGLLMAYKIKRFHLIMSFLISFAIFSTALSAIKGFSGGDSLNQLISALVYSPILFFSFVMLIEPLTSPNQRKFRIYYGAFIGGVLVLAQNLIPQISYSLELSLLVGNIFGRILNFNPQFTFVLKERKDLAKNISSFIFVPQKKIDFKAGQFMEWTVHHKNPDSRGVRRFFTISASPTENFMMLTTKLAEKPSSFKKTLFGLKLKDEITAMGPDGEFTIDENYKRPLVFIAGGIGITPFRSMIKYMLDKNIKRPITLFYSAKTTEEFVFREIFDEAEKTLELKTVYVVTDEKIPVKEATLQNIPVEHKIRSGYLDAGMIKEEVFDWQNRVYYISGPEPMVKAFEKMVEEMGVPGKNIKHDYFPGYIE